MKPEDRQGFRDRFRAALAEGKNRDEAARLAYAWLLLPRSKAHP